MPSLAHESVWLALTITRYTYPVVVLCYFILALTITVCTLQTQARSVRDEHVRRDVMLALIVTIAATYLIESVAILVDSLSSSSAASLGQDRLVYLIASTIAFGIQAMALADSKFPVWYPYYVTWLMGIIVESTLLVVPNSIIPPTKTFEFIDIVIQALRICTFLVLVFLYFGLYNGQKEHSNGDPERQSLLGKKLVGSEDSANGKGYGTTTDNSTSTTTDTDSWIIRQNKAEELIQKRLKEDGNWFTYAKGFTVFFQYVWPFHSKRLQLRALLVGVCLLSSNALNVLVPNQMGVMVDSLTKYVQGDHQHNIWLPVAIYTALKFVNSGACIGWIQKWLWMPVEQFSYDALSTASHAHIMNLSSDFHDSKTSSDLIQAVNGGRSVADLLETVCFQVIPMFIDLAVAFIYLWSLFGPYMGLMMGATVTSYLYITTRLVSRRSNKRRNYIAAMRKEWSVGYSSLDMWNTASLFNMIPYEQDRYSHAIKDHLKVKYTYEMSSHSISAAQGLIMTIGLLGALWLGVYQVAYEGRSVGKFTTLLIYWAQLSGPLTFFSSMFKNISYSLMDAERLLELFLTKPTIIESPNAKPLKFSKGLVKFDGVSFAYDDRKPTLKDVTFSVPSGKTVALVGETGGGKSTILKLIERFYDVKAGTISIDGQDIRDVTLTSLREKIGVVPQDPQLFNESIIDNIRYSRLSATDEEVHEACKAGAVHDKIMSFPDGYNSKVGHNGVKLSGGEKQRIAIARAILKQPEIILLDEATSAVDTETEQVIQDGFNTLCRDRTTFIVAHRLSTIMKADHILVIMDGEIVEQGSHDDLIHSKGKYHELWSKQILVKPTDEQPRSQSPTTQDTNIVNDLAPDLQKVELAKVMESTADQQGTRDAGGSKDGEGKGSGGGHQHEGFKLKPDAPEFVPLRSDIGPRSSSAKIFQKDTLNMREVQDSLHRIGNLGTKACKNGDSDYSVPKPSDKNYTLGGATGQPTETEASLVNKPKPKHSRPPRRHTSTSDLASKLQDPCDGVQDSDMTAVSSSESQPLLQSSSNASALQRNPSSFTDRFQQHHRVSSSSNPPSSSQDLRSTRTRRTRHWRSRNRSADNSGSSAPATAGSSYETPANDTRVPPVSIARPIEGANHTLSTLLSPRDL
ncbi:p-loop containing nucleoside triphosphate hydrolase [Venustampulla echinocandica]|uniref:p-loop containing nucleoside triphosphate hydrolase n=1 Tax=Venustampulla echinocandica TaxID=2656787 RepID=A0A370U350_9HELO|nr:p-loop containing nucleoside triphosphate hydrolase [Venustampulla echinocandica]RDL42197.1 p-loop containing nucleoside triphosphate hydrolase [Venustampulla echinocandica]